MCVGWAVVLNGAAADGGRDVGRIDQIATGNPFNVGETDADADANKGAQFIRLFAWRDYAPIKRALIDNRVCVCVCVLPLWQCNRPQHVVVL